MTSWKIINVSTNTEEFFSWINAENGVIEILPSEYGTDQDSGQVYNFFIRYNVRDQHAVYSTLDSNHFTIVMEEYAYNKIDGVVVTNNCIVCQDSYLMSWS